MASSLQIPDFDRDAIHVLPLGAIPLESAGLRRMRMVKNDELKSVIEVYGGASGSGQIDLAALSLTFPNLPTKDGLIIQKLAQLTSYDVYCLRVHMRAMGIDVDHDEHLKLSNNRQDELQDYMSGFTKRLIVEVFGTDGDVADFSIVLALYRNPDKSQAAAKLNKLAKTLGVDVHEVPAFLEDYGDVYLSIAYYRRYLESVQEGIEDFSRTVDEIFSHPHLGKNQSLVNISKRLVKTARKLNETAIQRFDVFKKYTDQMWEDMDKERFQSVSSLWSSALTRPLAGSCVPCPSR